jgi:hypothetical protein
MKRNNINFSHTFAYAKTLVAALFLLLNSQVSFSQINATVTGGACAGPFTLPLTGVLNGKNQFSGNIAVVIFGTSTSVPVSLSWNATNSKWEITGPSGVVFSSDVNTTPNPPCHSIGAWTATGGCTGGSFTASSGDCSIIPIELLDFSVKNANTANVMTWQTASEIKNKGFEIERSNDGRAWQNLGFVAGKGNNSTYTFTDKSPLPTSYYRLRQVDFDGQFDYSKVVVAKATGGKSAITVFPNPNTEGVIHIKGLSDEETNVSILNIYGQTVFQQTVKAESAVLNVKNVLSAGVYFVNIKTNNSLVTHKITKE